MPPTGYVTAFDALRANLEQFELRRCDYSGGTNIEIFCTRCEASFGCEYSGLSLATVLEYVQDHLGVPGGQCVAEEASRGPE